MEEQPERPIFRFSSKKQYEEEISRLLREESLDDEQYEALIDEYLVFCADPVGD